MILNGLSWNRDHSVIFENVAKYSLRSFITLELYLTPSTTRNLDLRALYSGNIVRMECLEQFCPVEYFCEDEKFKMLCYAI